MKLFKLKKIKKRKAKDQYDLNKLKDEEYRQKYAVEVKNRYGELHIEENEQIEENIQRKHK